MSGADSSRAGSWRQRLDRIGPYEVEGELGHGTQGVVLRARGPGGQPVAVKVLTARGPRAERIRKRLQREADALRRLDHPAVVRFLDSGEVEGRPWMSMELVEGQTLAARWPELGLRERVRVLARVSRGLAEAHALGIVHRDLKPENVLIRAVDGAALLTDFGVARDTEVDSSLTASGIAVGTPVYMAPETLQADEDPTPASDVYALGVLLYEALTDEHPFPTDEGVVALFRAVIHDRPQPPGLVAKDREVPRELESLCLAAMAKEPSQRPADAAAVADRLDDWLAGGSAVRRRGGPSPPVALAAAMIVGAGALAAVIVGLAGGDPADKPGPAPPSPGLPSPPQASGLHELVLQPGPLRGKDTTLRGDGLYLNDNAGAHAALLVGDRERQRGDLRALLEFDLQRLPPGAHLIEAWLELTPTDLRFEGRRGEPLQVEARLVAPDPEGLRTPWVEGSSLFDALLDGVAWDGAATPPGLGRDPRVFSGRPSFSRPPVEEQPLALLLLAPDAPRRTPVRFDVTAHVQAWLAGRPNLGFELRHTPEGAPWTDGGWSFASSDYPEPALRPSLVLSYEGSPPRPDEPESALEERTLAGLTADLDVLRSQRLPAAAGWKLALRLTREAPFLGEAFYWRGYYASRTDRVEVARSSLQISSAAARPFSEPPLFPLRGLCHLRLGSYSSAIADLTRAREHDPQNPSLRSQLALALVLEQKHDQARATLGLGGLGSVTPPRPGEVDDWTGALAAGVIHLSDGEPEQALPWLQRAAALEQRPANEWRSVLPLAQLANCLFALGRTAEGVRVFASASQASGGVLGPELRPVFQRWRRELEPYLERE